MITFTGNIFFELIFKNKPHKIVINDLSINYLNIKHQN